MKWNIKNENKGFTLVELILSVVILAFVVAPFLSSFLVANRSNAASKRKQEATDIGQLLAEQFKATDFKLLIGDVDGYSFETYPVLTEDGSETGKIGYRFLLENEDLPDTYNEAYHAIVTLEPNESEVNGKTTPVINNADTDMMAVYLSNFYRHDRDAGSSAESRRCTIRIRSEYSSELDLIYYVKLSVEYLNDVGNVVYEANDFGELNFTNEKPEVYLIYTPMSENDEIIINNTISPEILTDEDGEQQKINIYLAMQNIDEFKVLNPNNIALYSTDEDGNEGADYTTLREMQEDAGLEGNDIYETATTCLYTNVPDDMENLVGMTEKDTLYDMTVVVYYNEDTVTTINSTKNISDKGDDAE